MASIRPKLYKDGNFQKRLSLKQEIIYSPNNKESVIYRGRAYELFDDSFDISKKSYPISDCSYEDSKISKADEFFIEKRSFKTLVFLNMSLNKFNSFLYELDLNKVLYIQSGISNRTSENTKYKKANYYVRFSNEYVDSNKDFERKIKISFQNSLEGSYKKSIIKEIGKIISLKNQNNQKEEVLKYINQISLTGISNLIIELYKTKSSELLENLKIKKDFNTLNQRYLYQIDKIKFLENELKNDKNNKNFIKQINEKEKDISDLYSIIDEYETEINQLKTIQISSEKSNNQNKLINYLNGFLETFAPSIVLIGNSEINFVNKFNRFAEVLYYLKNLDQNLNQIKFKKIKTLHGWTEINSHITTGNEKKGRIYFKKIKESKKILVYLDYKENDKSQKRVFKYLSKLDLKEKLIF